MKLVVTKSPKKISIISKMGRMIRFGDLVGIVSPSIKHKLFKTPDISNSDIVGLLENRKVYWECSNECWVNDNINLNLKHAFITEVQLNKFVEIPDLTISESEKAVFLKVYIGKPEPRKIEIHQAAYWPINTTDYIAIEFHRAEQHDFSGFESALNDLDTIDFGDLPPYVHLLVEQIFNRESVGYALTSHVLQEIEDRAYQMTV